MIAAVLLAMIASPARGASLVVGTAADVVDYLPPWSLREVLTFAVPPVQVTFSHSVFPDGSRTPIALIAANGALPEVRPGVDLLSSWQVAIDGSALVSGDGLLLRGDNLVTGLEVRGFPGNGVRIEGATGPVTFGSTGSYGANAIHGNKKCGVLVHDSLGAGAEIRGNTIGVDPASGTGNGNCAGTGSSVPCAGVLVDGSTVGEVLVESNVIVATLGNPTLFQGAGVLLAGGADHQVTGNLVGLLGDTGPAAANVGVGIDVHGLTAPIVGLVVEDNTVAGNGSHGIRLGSGSIAAMVLGNRIGTDNPGAVAIGNGKHGVKIFGSDGHSVLDNVISGNAEDGISMGGANGTDWHSHGVIRGNRIGTDASGTYAVPNHGLGIYSSGAEGAYEIGGPNPGEGNLVSGNLQAGIGLFDPDHVVQGNRVGTTADGSAAIPNGTDASEVWAGIRAGGDRILIGGELFTYPNFPELGPINQVSGNHGEGIVVGHADDVRVLRNLVGAGPMATPVPGLGQGEGGIRVAGGTGHLIAWNVVLGSGHNAPFGAGAPGIEVSNINEVYGTRDVVLHTNEVGTDPWDAPDGNSGAGILIERSEDGAAEVSDVELYWNDVFANGAAGVAVVRAERVDIHDNEVGADVTGLGNAGSGIFLSGATTVDIDDNAIAGNAGAGVALQSSTWAMHDVEVTHNTITGNAESGIQGAQDPTDPAIYGVQLVDNEIAFNGEYGVELLGPVDKVGVVQQSTLATDRIHDNGLCAIELLEHPDGGLPNGGAPAPSVTASDAVQITGTIADGWEVDALMVQVYADPGAGYPGEAREWLGDAIPVGTSWSLPVGGYALEDLKAVLVLDNGGTSEATKRCGDGCDGHDPGLCDDDDPCTWEHCDETAGCLSGFRPEGFRCSDGNGWTGVQNPTRYEPDHCDGAGACVAGSPLTVADCPFATPCNNTYIDPYGIASGCRHQAVCADGLCRPYDLDLSGFAGCQACAECDLLDDDDDDGLKDDWEDQWETVDLDCDGIPGGFHEPPSVGPKDLFWEVDFMAERCPPQQGDHSHQMPADLVDELEDRFEERGYILHIDASGCIPETIVTGFGPDVNKQAPVDPDCQEWIPFADLKSMYFTPARNGTYHYAVMGHSKRHNAEYGGGLDGECKQPGFNRSMAAARGDIAIVVETGGTRYEEPFETGPPASPTWILKGPAHNVAQISFMHEGGHNMDLLHGGIDGLKAKPNFQSVMSYAYEFHLFHWDAAEDDIAYAQLDYSREQMPPLQEYGLLESVGLPTTLPPSEGYAAKWWCENLEEHTYGRTDGGWLDWNCDGVEDVGPISADIDRSGTLEELEGSAEWGALYMTFQCGGGLQGWEPPDASVDDARRLGAFLPPLLVDVDLVPGCAVNPIPTDGSGHVELVIFGDERWSVIEAVVPTLKLHGARARRVEIVDHDEDGDDDLLAEFPVDQVLVVPNGEQVMIHGRLPDSRPLFATSWFTPVDTHADADGDTVVDECDACPGTPPGTPVGEDGCP